MNEKKLNEDKVQLIFENKLVLLFIIGLIMAGCGTAGSVREKPLPTPEEPEEETAVSKELSDTLDNTRSELDDTFSKKNDVPDYFLQKSSSDRRGNIGNPYTGFRIQIISTRDIAKAKKIANNFRVWADKHIIGYAPQAYLTFDQPYYKVHVGNFQFQQRASNFTQMIKSKYPGAWVVHDKIKPDGVPRQKIQVVN